VLTLAAIVVVVVVVVVFVNVFSLQLTSKETARLVEPGFHPLSPTLSLRVGNSSHVISRGWSLARILTEAPYNYHNTSRLSNLLPYRFPRTMPRRPVQRVAVQPSQGKKISFDEDEAFESGPSDYAGLSGAGKSRNHHDDPEQDEEEDEDDDDDAPEAVGMTAGREMEERQAAEEAM
jgi:hypothetical protein